MNAEDDVVNMSANDPGGAEANSGVGSETERRNPAATAGEIIEDARGAIPYWIYPDR